MIGQPNPMETDSLGSSLATKVSSLEESTSSLLEESSSSTLLAGGCLNYRGVVFLANAGLGAPLPVERFYAALWGGGSQSIGIARKMVEDDGADVEIGRVVGRARAGGGGAGGTGAKAWEWKHRMSQMRRFFITQ